MKMHHAALLTLWTVATGALSYAAHVYRDDIVSEFAQAQNSIEHIQTPQWLTAGVDAVEEPIGIAISSLTHVRDGGLDFVFGKMNEFLVVPKQNPEASNARKLPAGFHHASYDIAPPPPPSFTLSELKTRQEEDEEARLYANIQPAASLGAPFWTPEQNDLDVEAVLVPRQVTVISSSQDGRISSIPFSHGDRFKKGDILVAYDCANIRAEADIARIEKSFTQKRLQGSDTLFKLDIISDLDRAGAQIEDEKAAIKGRLYKTRLQDCDIRAEFDGRVTNRLANAGEYTRTDRVLLEVASEEPLQAEFLVPSKWLRWINIGAPLSITVNETEKTYTAKVTRIHGEVDPVSQSIQMIATLDSYDDPLMPGMSGKAAISVNTIRDAGISGYLETSASAGAQ